MAPFFSVIIPAFDRQQMLDEAVASVLSQTFGDWELLVVDDASPIPLEVVRDPRIRLFRCDQNVGKSAVVNRALDEARGAVIAFLDDDDLWRPERLANARAAHETAAIAICRSGQVALPRSNAPGNDTSAPPMRPMRQAELARVELPAHMCATSVRKDACPRFDETFRACEDLEWGLRLLERDPEVIFIDSEDFLWRRHGGVRHLNNREVRIAASKRLLSLHREKYDRYPARRAFRLYRLGSMYLDSGSRLHAVVHAVRSLTARPNLLAVRLVVRALLPNKINDRLTTNG